MRRAILILLVVFCLLPATLPKATLAEPVTGRWGAIAYSYATGKYGLTYDYATQAQAINSAVERCKAADCKAVVWFENSCGAFSRGTRAYGWGIGQTRALAEANALAECRKRGGNCGIVAWACTTR